MYSGQVVRVRLGRKTTAVILRAMICVYLSQLYYTCMKSMYNIIISTVTAGKLDAALAF